MGVHYLDRAIALAFATRQAILLFLRLRIHVFRGRITPPQNIAPLAANRLYVDLLVLVCANEVRRGLDDIGVEGAGKATFAGDNQHQHVFLRTGQQQRMPHVARLGIVRFQYGS